MKKLTGVHRVLDDSIYTEYLKYRLPKKVKCKDRSELKKIVKSIFKAITEELLEKQYGVYIEGFGYLFIWKIPRKMSYNILKNGGEVEECFNYKTNNYMYSPMFIANKFFKGWSMDNTFNKTFKQKLKSQLLSGKKYKTYINSLSGFLKNVKNEFIK